uniref:Elongator complex protein 2 n=1 Tax=Rhipicephalus pulchellus TaxID=72859 RepID=L7M717_RHIPC
MAVSVEYTSCACNRNPQSLDWGCNNVVAYGACNAVVLYDPEANGGAGAVTHTLVDHNAKVNCVRWIRRKNGAETALLSTSVDKTVTIWAKKDDRFIPAARLVGHEDAVTTADALYSAPSSNDLIVASAGGDFSIRIWEVDAEFTTKCVQEINLKGNFAMDIRMCFLPSTCVPLMAYGGNDMMVHCYYKDSTVGFVKCHTLYGHEDWVRGISFKECADDSVFIASCSQDSVIRIWKISPCRDDEMVNSNSTPGEIKLRGSMFTATLNESSRAFDVGLETVLSGHEGWVYSVHWCPATSQGEDGGELHSLLSASMDKTVVVWEPDSSTGLWLDKARFGDIGGNTLGFLGAVFGPDGNRILAHGFQGSFHMWKRPESDRDNLWQTTVTPGGHFDKVGDIAWSAGGEYLLSCSSDQTTRLHAPWIMPQGSKSWKEIARPQVHGHDLACIASTGRLQFVSGAEEKVLRAFEGTRNFIDNFKRLCGADLLEHCSIKELAEGASVPSLGLSNKAVYESDLTRNTDDAERHPKNQFPEFYFKPVVLTEPPTEEDLLQNTLWTEVRKLYGHGYELFALTSSHDGKLIASACKASTQQHAAIILWDTATWKQVGELVFHNLTITQMEFSPDNHHLLSVSRDRSWCIHRIDISGNVFTRVAFADKKAAIHQRIIWSCAWSHDGLYFVTASRDKKVVVWGRRAGSSPETSLGPFESKAQLSVEDSATAVSFAPSFAGGDRYLIAVGLEKGSIHLYHWSLQSGWTLYETLQQSVAHHLSVKRLKFCPRQDHQSAFLLASCGDDHMVRVYNISQL